MRSENEERELPPEVGTNLAPIGIKNNDWEYYLFWKGEMGMRWELRGEEAS